jgi:hypothetical protein
MVELPEAPASARHQIPFEGAIVCAVDAILVGAVKRLDCATTEMFSCSGLLRCLAELGNSFSARNSMFRHICQEWGDEVVRTTPRLLVSPRC